MNLREKFKTSHLAALAVGVAIGLVAVGTASAAVHPATVTKHYLTIPAAAFIPDGNDSASAYYNQWDPSDLSSTGTPCFNTSAQFPNGAKITFFKVFYTSNTNLLYAELNRQNVSLHHDTVLAEFNDAPTTSGAWGVHGAAVTANNVVNTLAYDYGLGVCLGGDAQLAAVQITYTTG
jgi:hypothetical protein